MIDFKYVDEPSPKTDEKWKKSSDKERIDLINKAIANPGHDITIVSAKEDGQVLLNINEVLPASERGEFLLDLEYLMKENVDKGITVWLEPIGDKSSLRNLRGIEVKS